ncbi:MAG: hypothetical protein R3A78_13855 [Polyangiales bacterium]
MTRDLVRLEGLYVGGSSGAAVAGALKYARQTQQKQNILVMVCDSAAKYLSKIFNDDWMRENGFLEDESGLGVVRQLLDERQSDQAIGSPRIACATCIGRMKQLTSPSSPSSTREAPWRGGRSGPAPLSRER